MQPADEQTQTLEEQLAALETARQAHGREPDNRDFRRDLFARLLAAAGTQMRRASFRPAADHLTEALDLCYAPLHGGGVDLDEEAQAVSTIGDALYVAKRVPTERKQFLLEAASRATEWLREHSVSSAGLDAVRPELRYRLRQARAGQSSGEWIELQSRLNTAWETVRREPLNPDGWRAVLSAAATLGRFWRSRSNAAAAADACLDALLAWNKLVARNWATRFDHDVATRLIEDIAAGKPSERNPSLTFTVRRAKLLAAAATTLAQLDTDQVLSARLAACAPALKNLRRQAGEREAPPSALIVPPLPPLPPACASILGEVNVHDLEWQIAHWDLHLEKEEAVGPLVDPKFLLMYLAANRLRPDLCVARAWTLPSYASARLALLLPPEAGDGNPASTTPHAWVLLAGLVPHQLGSASDLQGITRITQLTLTEGNVAAYVRFFCCFVRAGREPFVVLDRQTFGWMTGASGIAELDAPELFPDARPVRAVGTADTYDFQTDVLYAGQAYRASFRVSGAGQVALVDYEAYEVAEAPLAR